MMVGPITVATWPMAGPTKERPAPRHVWAVAPAVAPDPVVAFEVEPHAPAAKGPLPTVGMLPAVGTVKPAAALPFSQLGILAGNVLAPAAGAAKASAAVEARQANVIFRKFMVVLW
jgi:hypothetical protein